MSTCTTTDKKRLPISTLRGIVSEKVKKLIKKQTPPTKKKFAQISGLSPSTISKITKGKATISPISAIEIAKNCNVTLDYIFGLSDYDSLSASAVSMIEQHLSANISEREFEYCGCPRKYHIPIISVSKCFKDYLDNMRKSTRAENDSIRDAYKESAGKILTQANNDDNNIRDDYVLIPLSVLNNPQMLEDLGIMPETEI